MKTSLVSQHFHLIVFLLSISTAGFSQTLSGTVIDHETQETIAFANVLIGDSYGVITNGEGQFNIAVDRFTPNDSLVFSFLGYARKSVAIKDFTQQNIYLEPLADSLDEVYLIDKNLDPATILERVNNNLSKNHKEQFQKWTVFQRSKTSNDVKDLEFKISKADFIDKKTLKELNLDLEMGSKQSKNDISNIYVDTYYDLYKNPENNVKLSIIKGTKLLNRERNTSMENIQSRAMTTIADKLNSSNSFKVRSGIIPIGDSISLKTMFSGKNDSLDLKGKSEDITKILTRYGFGKDSDLSFITDYKKYNYTIANALSYNNELVYVLQFEPAKSAADYSGEIYVSADSYAVLKVQYKLAEGKRGRKVNLKLLLGIKYEELGKEVMVIFNKNTDNIYVPKYVKTSTREYTFFDRSLTFIENAPRKERMKLKLNILSEAIVSKEDEILIIDTQNISESEFSAFQQVEKSLIETISKYNPEVWSKYNIISPNQAIKDFEN